MENDIDLNRKLEAYGMKLEFWKVDDLEKLSKATRNPKLHRNQDIAALTAAIKDVGFKNMVFIDKAGTHIPAGNGRILAAKRCGLDELPVIRILDLNKTRLKKFALGDNKLRSEKYDEQILIENLMDLKQAGESFEYLDFGKYADALKEDMAAEEEKIAQAIQEIDAGEPYRAPGGPVGGMTPDLSPIGSQPLKLIQDMPEAKSPDLSSTPTIDWPSEPEWDIPILSKKYMAKHPDQPVVKWGEIAAAKNIGGTWTFYVLDDKFMSLFRKSPDAPCRGAKNCVEVNYSIYDSTPKAAALYGIYKKRYLARYWQSLGMNIFVDLNTNEKFYEWSLLGVPDGWMAWATRGYSARLDLTKREYAMAVEKAGTDDPAKGFVFMIYGGGKDVQAYANEIGAFWFPERMQEVSSGKVVSGQPLKVSPGQYEDIS